MSFEYDDGKHQPRVVLEGENGGEDDQLKILAAFKSVTFAVVIDDDEEEVEAGHCGN
jgi:hypothetical protein